MESIIRIRPYDRKRQLEVDQLLAKEGIKRDQNLEETFGLYNDQDQLVATGSYFHNTLRCVAVDSDYQGLGLMNQMVTYLIGEQFQRGVYHLFVYTKASCRQLFKDLGFSEIAYVDQEIVFMENRKEGFTTYLQELQKLSPKTGEQAAIIMNANPFTNGHLALVEKASRENDWVHLFVVEEEASVFPFDIRYDLVQKGTQHLGNIIYHPTGPYLISSATFPAYFQRDHDAVIRSQSMVDALVFKQIAAALKIRRRYVGSEPFSHVTHLYNQTLHQVFEEGDLALIEVERIQKNGHTISASKVREMIQQGQIADLKEYVPESTFNYLWDKVSQPIITKIQQSDEVKHY